MLKIKELEVSVDGNKILKGITLIQQALIQIKHTNN